MGFRSSKLTANSLKMCPEVTLTCSIVDLPSTSLRWFFNGNEFARYTISTNDFYPMQIEPENTTHYTLLGCINIRILEASVNEDNPDRANFLSTITCNVSSLQRAGISTISCGSFTEMAIRYLPQEENLIFPSIMGVSVQPQYDLQSRITTIRVQWNEVVSFAKN